MVRERAADEPMLRARLAGGAVAACLAHAAVAQPVERHLPPAPAPAPATIPTAAAPSPSEDARPIAGPLRAIVVLGPTAPVRPPDVAPGVDVDAASRLADARGRRVLARFLGRPISRQLISQIQTAIVRRYRALGHPLVDVSTPPQEIDKGVLQFRVIEFRLGQTIVRGGSRRDAAAIARGLRVRPGGPIDTPKLAEDLSWLNLYPYRRVSAAFSPGAGLAQTDLALTVTDLKPWSVSAGYETSDSRSTGPDRIFIGGAAGLPALNDASVSVQLTGSADFWVHDRTILGNPAPAYESAAGVVTLPTWPRQALELTLNAVETNTTTDPFATRQQTFESTLAYRSALSNLVDLPGDVEVGLEFKRQKRLVSFGGTPILRTAADVLQIETNWSDAWTTRLGQTSLKLSLHVSPGGLDGLDTTAALSGFDPPRSVGARYAYGALDFGNVARLPFDATLLTQVSGQYASGPLPETEQAGIGGDTFVRGYLLEDGAFDDALVLRNELRAPAATLGHGDLAAALAPYVYADAALARDADSDRSTAISSLGVGTEFQLGPRLTGHLQVGRALASSEATHAGDWRVEFSAAASY